MKEKPKMYIVRKYIKAVSAMEAIKKDKTTPVHECWVEEGFTKTGLAESIGFDSGVKEEE